MQLNCCGYQNAYEMFMHFYINRSLNFQTSPSEINDIKNVFDEKNDWNFHLIMPIICIIKPNVKLLSDLVLSLYFLNEI